MKDEGKRKSLIHRLKESYRLILLKDVTFREIASYKLSPLKVLIYTFSGVVLLGILFTLIVIYTPVKQFIPGYGELESNQPYMDLRKRVNVLERELSTYQLYVEGFRLMLSDSIDHLGEMESGPSLQEESYTIVERIPEDDSLRARVDINRDLLRMATMRNGNQSMELGSPESQYYFLPINGLISNRFKSSNNHYGIDFIAPEGSPIKAVADGVVFLSSNIMKTGYTIGIQHENDVVTYYMHNSTLLKNKGDVVKAGEAIAIIGNTGELTSGPHLHFEMWYKGEALDPEKYLPLTE